jgi:hypothetical protein
MEFASQQRKERDVWLAMRFGCCASRADGEDREVLRENGMFGLSCSFLRLLRLPYLHPLLRVFFSISLLSSTHTVVVELHLRLAYYLLNLVNQSHPRPLYGNRRPIYRNYVSSYDADANDHRQGSLRCRSSTINHKPCNNREPSQFIILAHPPAGL